MGESGPIAPLWNVGDAIVHERMVSLSWTDGTHDDFLAIWLRDNCLCTQCRHETSGQRLLDTALIPAGVTIERAVLAGEVLDVVWSGDGHVSRFPLAWLREHAYSSTVNHDESLKLWDASIANSLPSGQYEEVSRRDAALRDWLSMADAYGFALLWGVPTEPGSLFRVVDLFGYVRETNYGRLFDVQSVVNPTNLAFTGLALGAHTDNPYRDPTPTLQLLHCLSSSAAGGDSTLVDGFRVAQELRRTDPDAFELLSRQPVRFHYRDANSDLSTRTTIIGLSPWGEITSIHFNNRSKAPLSMRADRMESFYDAYRTFAAMLADPAFEIQITLGAGHLLLMDNMRVLHGRTGFSAEGTRHLQGCYADRDGLRSKLALLRGEEPKL